MSKRPRIDVVDPNHIRYNVYLLDKLVNMILNFQFRGCYDLVLQFAL